MNRTRRTAVASLVTLALTLPLAGAAPAWANDSAAPSPVPALPLVPESASAAAPVPVQEKAGQERLELPRPTGRYAVGAKTLSLTDTERTDPWVPESGDRRLLVDLRYPARPGGGPRTPYITVEEAQGLLERTSTHLLIPKGNAELLAATRTHAREGARPAKGKFPLVVLSPGFTLPRTTLGLLAEELASRGYVVASVDHPYESEATAFPGEGVLPCAACRKVQNDEVPIRAVPEGRSRDVSFLLDRLTGREPVWRHAKMIDRKRVGMAGHSIGGNTASRVMEEDRRVRAGVNMDGGFFAPVPEDGLDGRPFMMLGSEDAAPGGAFTNWDSTWPRLDGWKRWLTVTGGHHFSFLDGPALADQVEGAPVYPGVPSGERSAAITRTYVGAFFDRHLKGLKRPVLDGPSQGNPEVVFHRP
ncbi:alpha/beta hydrolase [Streptomyces sp. NPDC000594]|uniref:alpha/beta hydrolase family protein n=1 Tax=Streptomyces sp. NPDC000594 TaxID=3154261 RepID=UPI0033201EA4